jgi:hypothetical protein
MDKQSNSIVAANHATETDEEQARKRIRVVGAELVQLLGRVPGASTITVSRPTDGSAQAKIWMYYPIPLGIEPEPIPEEPYSKVRRLSKELSETLTECDDGRWYACIWPKDDGVTGTAAFPHKDDPELPVDRVNRLAQELSVAMDDWHEHAGTKFFANVYRASSGRGVWFRNEQTEGRVDA